MEILIKNIKGLVQVEDEPVIYRAGTSMSDIRTITNAWLHIRDGKIESFGEMTSFPGEIRGAELINAEGRSVFPCAPT